MAWITVNNGKNTTVRKIFAMDKINSVCTKILTLVNKDTKHKINTRKKTVWFDWHGNVLYLSLYEDISNFRDSSHCLVLYNLYNDSLIVDYLNVDVKSTTEHFGTYLFQTAN